MYNLNSVYSDCKRNIEAMGIPIAKEIRVSVNRRAHKRYGQCKKERNEYSININVDLLNEQNPLSALQNTMYHELLHTCPGCMNHGEQWKKYAAKVNKITGLNIKRCSSPDEKGLNLFYQNAKYSVVCKECGKKWAYQRAGKVVQHPEKFKCRCGGKLAVFEN